MTDETPAAYGQITKVEGNTISYKIVTKEDIDDYMGLFVSQTVDNSDILDDLNEEELLQQVEQQAIDSGFAEEAANRMVQNALADRRSAGETAGRRYHKSRDQPAERRSVSDGCQRIRRRRAYKIHGRGNRR